MLHFQRISSKPGDAHKHLDFLPFIPPPMKIVLIALATCIGSKVLLEALRLTTQGIRLVKNLSKKITTTKHLVNWIAVHVPFRNVLVASFSFI